MRYISTILSVVALGLIAVLFFTQNRQLEQLKKHVDVEKQSAGTGFKVAYFDMDSLEAHYTKYKDALGEVKTSENDMNMELARMDRDMQKKMEGWRQKQATMTQAEGEQAQQEYQQLQQRFAGRKQELEQSLYKKTEDLKTGIRRTIEDFLHDYNKQKNYSYIIQYDANSFIYTKDSAYNITADVVEGLNSAYKKK
jgi:outer membrane protein